MNATDLQMYWKITIGHRQVDSFFFLRAPETTEVSIAVIVNEVVFFCLHAVVFAQIKAVSFLIIQFSALV